MQRQPVNVMHIHAQRGFSIVETLVAVTLSLIVLAGVMAVMYSSKVIYNENERVGRLQEGGRAALDLILRDLRGAGFPGCAQPIDGLFSINNVLTNNAEVEWNLAQPVYGFEATGGAWAPALDADLIPDATANNDIIVVRTIPTGTPSMRVTSLVAPNADILVDKDLGERLAPGSTAVISDCGNASIFAVSGFVADGDDLGATISHAAGGGPPTNATTSLNATFLPGARVAPITSIVYYIAPNAADTGPSLWRVVANGAPQEVVPGVEAMQIRYGADTNNNGDVDAYFDADDVANWNQVISVALAMLVRSAEENAQEVDAREYTLLDTVVGPFDDNFQRSLFTTTVTLRNRTN